MGLTGKGIAGLKVLRLRDILYFWALFTQKQGLLKPPVCLRGLIILMFVSALLSSAVPGFAQEDPHFELRTNFVHQHYLSKGGFWIRNDVGYRHYFEETPASMLLLRPRAVIELTGIVDVHLAGDWCGLARCGQVYV